MNVSAEMPKYKCHKEVWALKIKEINKPPHSYLAKNYTIVPDDTHYAPFDVPVKYFDKHDPQPGGYYVVYEDGYTSYSPAAAFESGYIPKAEAQHAKIERIARVCHEVNRAYCQALGDDSQPSWETAPAWQRESARMGVDLHLMGDFGPEASHTSWMQQKISDGWKYGPVKNPETKEHPCLVPFAELPKAQQAKDYLFRAVVHALKEF